MWGEREGVSFLQDLVSLLDGPDEAAGHPDTDHLQESQADYAPDDGPCVGTGRVSDGFVAGGHVDL